MELNELIQSKPPEFKGLTPERLADSDVEPHLMSTSKHLKHELFKTQIYQILLEAGAHEANTHKMVYTLQPREVRYAADANKGAIVLWPVVEQMSKIFVSQIHKREDVTITCKEVSMTVSPSPKVGLP